jgi:putative phosphonate metabolism protein
LSESRYALYFAPETDSGLWKLASEWLGRDAATGEVFEGQQAEVREWTSSPRLYGFHATLKPPFPLHGERSESELVEALEDWARARKGFAMPPMHVASIGTFLALTLREPQAELSELAEACVRDFDRFRRPASAAELDRRRGGLTERQTELLERWGYPYVLDQWRFHMTLTSSIPDAAVRHRLHRMLTDRMREVLEEPCPVDSVCLFVQPGEGAPFRFERRFRFGS